VDANTGVARSGTLTIAGQAYTVSQLEAGCSYSVNNTMFSVPAAGGANSATVTTALHCSWTAASNAPWLTINSPATGTGNSSVQFTAAANTGPPRSGTFTLAGQAVTVSQSGGCSYSLDRNSQTLPPGSATGVSVAVTSGAGCTWNASSNSSWIALTSPASGSGNGSVSFDVAANVGVARTGTLTIAGVTFTVSQQEAGCTYSLSGTTVAVAASGGANTVTIATASHCSWTATSNASWLTITPPANGTGGGYVQFTAAASTEPGRSGTLSIAGQTVTVTQSSGCTYSLGSAGQSVPEAGVTGASVSVSTGGNCPWSATSNVSFITITSGANGGGAGSVVFNVGANTGPARSGTLTIAGQTFTVSQAAVTPSCTYSISPTSVSVDEDRQDERITVTAPAGCTWTAQVVTGLDWLTITDGASGTGTDRVRVRIDRNNDPNPRTGTLLIAGHTFTIHQDGR
jgi:hypothetical protein